MKKNLFTIMLAFLVVFGMNAQDFGAVNTNGKAKENVFAKKSTMKNGLRSGKASFLSEPFDTEIPATWTVEADAGADYTWIWDAAGYANCDSDAPGSGYTTAGTLTSPTIDVSGATSLFVAFDHYYKHLGSQHAEVEVYDGTAWQEIAAYSASTGDMDHVEIDVTTYINANFAVRFHFSDEGGWDWWWHVDNVSVFSPEAHDFGVDAVTPTFVLSGSTVAPTVTLHNYGATDEATWSLQLTGTDGYNQTVADAATIAAGADYVVTFPDWTPADGTYDLTATITLAGDADNTNDVKTVSCAVEGLADAYGGNSSDGLYGTVVLADGTFAQTGTMGTTPFPMAAEFNGVNMYRVNNDLSFGTVSPAGVYTNLGMLTGFSGTPTGLAWDWTNNIMYALVLDGANAPHLCTLDIASLVLTEIGAGTGMIIGMDMANDGFLYGPALNDESLYKIDPATGATTLIGSTGLVLNYGQDVSYDAATNKLYTISCGDDYKFGTYDLTTGAFTLIFDFTNKQFATFAITKDGTPPSTAPITFVVDNTANTSYTGFALKGSWDASGNYDNTWNGGAEHTNFYDDGTHGDATAGDDIWTVVVNLVPDAGANSWEWGVNDQDGTWIDGNFAFTVSDDSPQTLTYTTTGVNELSSKGISVYPNPSNGTFNVNVESNFSLEIFDITGKVLNTRVLNGNSTISIDNAGVYFLRFSNKEGSVTQKVIVQ